MTIRVFPFYEEEKAEEDITKSKRFLLSSAFLSSEDVSKNENEALLEAVTYAQENWLNSVPLTHASINEDMHKAYLFKISEATENKVILFDIWNYAVLHSVKSLAYLREWHERYEPAGLIIIGVHVPFFKFSRDKKNVTDALKQLDITYPVVLDNDLAYWHATETAAWPKRVIMGPKGETTLEVDSDGYFQELELEIQNQLRQISPGLACPPILKPKYTPDPKGGEVFLGKKNANKIGNKVKLTHIGHEIKFMENQTITDVNTPYLSGKWVLGEESVHPTLTVQLNAKDPTDLESKFTIKLKCKNLYIVAGVITKNPGEVIKPIKMIVTMNKRPMREDQFGTDTSFSETKKTQLVLKDPRLLHVGKNMDSNTANEFTFTINNEGYETAEIFAIFYEG